MESDLVWLARVDLLSTQVPHGQRARAVAPPAHIEAPVRHRQLVPRGRAGPSARRGQRASGVRGHTVGVLGSRVWGSGSRV